MRQQIASAVHLVVQLSRAGSGKRLVTSISEVTGVEPSGTVAIKTLFGFDPDERRLRPTGLVSCHFDRLQAAGGLTAHDLFERRAMNLLVAALNSALIYLCSRHFFRLRSRGWGGEVARLERRAAELGDPVHTSIGAWAGLAVAAVVVGAFRISPSWVLPWAS